MVEALRAGAKPSWIRVDSGARPCDKLREIEELAAANKITVRHVARAALDEISATGAHNGVIAKVGVVASVPVPTLISQVVESRGALIVAIGLRGHEELGVLLRSAECAGAAGVLVPPGPGAAVSSRARRLAMGAAERLAVAEGSVAPALERCQAAGVRVVAVSERGDGPPFFAADLTGPVAIVLGDAAEIPDGRIDVRLSMGFAGRKAGLPPGLSSAVVLYERERQGRRPS